MRAIEAALGASDAATGLFDLASRLGAPTSLSQLGMPCDGIETAVGEAMATPYPNPRPLEAGSLHRLVSDAWAGRRPNERIA